MIKPVLVIHGGAGAISRARTTPEIRQDYEAALQQVLEGAGAILARDGSALDAVTEAVRLLEECPLFNAGYGAVFTSEGKHELDASIMDGNTLKSGAVANVTILRNPVLAARAVMERSSHVFFVGPGAEAYARSQGLECVAADFFSTSARREQLERVRRAGAGLTALDHDAQAMSFAPLDETRKLGTVGAVALDSHGDLAAATSTGGMTNKQPGRVGDAPLIGAGCYANNRSCAVSTTGTGEAFIRMVAAYDVSAQMEYGGCSLADAAERVVHVKLPRIGGSGGLIAVDAQGQVCMPFNTEGMYRGYMYAGQRPFVAIHT
ncbi:isoaspartyl peptidase/L-asparaginase family protein [Pollutimonas bauzanensis]|uniref:Isoaspartyl peptidase n=1 Tax=Pollutimonas bauzanensis TaxID=658167 RepID=A0A1M5UVR2_9BURK|nr:isoaspartyl peptidase/L-asparaginase [Pollutimonas bauzanensis]SHH66958.1 beta-aspartyl-peptidase (threonine type) [Pollutimonas bauzanensis]